MTFNVNGTMVSDGMELDFIAKFTNYIPTHLQYIEDIVSFANIAATDYVYEGIATTNLRINPVSMVCSAFMYSPKY